MLDQRTVYHTQPEVHRFVAPATYNPYYLPWILRGVLGGERLATDCAEEVERLKDDYVKWTPQTRAMRDLKLRLEPMVGPLHARL